MMAVVDIDYEFYRCPHCSGCIIIRKQFPHDGDGCGIQVSHTDNSTPTPESGEELEELEGLRW